MSKSWQICAVLAAIFAAGGLSGGLVAYRLARRNSPRPSPPEVWVPRQIERFARVLHLTLEQRQRIAPIMEKNIQELGDLRHQSMRASREIVDRMDAAIAAELTADQRAHFERIVKERRDAWRRLQDRGAHGGREHPPGPPPEAGSQPPPPPPPPADKTAGT